MEFGDPGASSSAGPTQLEILAGVAFWILLGLVAAALPVTLAHGTKVDVGNAPTLAAIFLGGPAVGGWVAMIGTTELRELRGEVPWYGILANRASIVIPAIVSGLVFESLDIGSSGIGFLARAMVAGLVFYGVNVLLVGILVALRSEIQSGPFFGRTLLPRRPQAWLSRRSAG